MTQRTRVVQRSQRMILVLVDGQTNVRELGAKIGDAKVAEAALKELEAGGFIHLLGGTAAAVAPARPMATPSQLSQFSTFGPKPTRASLASAETVMPSNLSGFGRGSSGAPKAQAVPRQAEHHEDEIPPEQSPGRFAGQLKPAKAVGAGLALLGLAAVATVLFYPYDNYRAPLEAELAQQFGVPVRIGSVAPRLLPTPSLELGGVKLGSKGEGRLDSVLIPGLLSRMLGGQERPPQADILGGLVPVSLLAGWAASGGSPMAPAKLRIKGLRLALGDLVLPELEGQLTRTGSGGTQLLSLASSDRSFKLELTPQGRSVGISLEANGWKLGNAFTLDFVSAQGVLRNDKVAFSNADIRFLDGRYDGDLLVDWSKGMAMTGSGSLHRLSAARLATLGAPLLKVAGEISGTWRFRTEGKSAAELGAALEGDGVLQMERGDLQAVDLIEAVRRGKGHVVRGGSTRFERLSGDVRINAQGLSLTGLQMEAGLVRAAGQVEVSREGGIQGRFTVDLSRSGAGTTVAVSGRLPSLEAVAQ